MSNMDHVISLCRVLQKEEKLKELNQMIQQRLHVRHVNSTTTSGGRDEDGLKIRHVYRHSASHNSLLPPGLPPLTSNGDTITADSTLPTSSTAKGTKNADSLSELYL